MKTRRQRGSRRCEHCATFGDNIYGTDPAAQNKSASGSKKNAALPPHPPSRRHLECASVSLSGSSAEVGCAVDEHCEAVIMLPSRTVTALARSASLAKTAPKALGAAPMQVHGKVSPTAVVGRFATFSVPRASCTYLYCGLRCAVGCGLPGRRRHCWAVPCQQLRVGSHQTAPWLMCCCLPPLGVLVLWRGILCTAYTHGADRSPHAQWVQRCQGHRIRRVWLHRTVPCQHARCVGSGAVPACALARTLWLREVPFHASVRVWCRMLIPGVCRV